MSNKSLTLEGNHRGKFSRNENLRGSLEFAPFFKFPFVSLFQQRYATSVSQSNTISNPQFQSFNFRVNKPTPTDITKIFYILKLCSEKFFLFFFSAVIFFYGFEILQYRRKELSIQITFCGEALECYHSILFKMQFVFCVGRSFVCCVCMSVFVVLACLVCTVAMPVLNDESGGERLAKEIT